MTRRTQLTFAALITGLAVLLVGSWAALRGDSEAPSTRDRATTRHRKVGTGFGDAMAKSRARGAQIPRIAPARDDGMVSITGTILEVGSGAPVPAVEVVFRSSAGEESTTADKDGTYHLEVPAGMYRAFVRDDAVLSVGRMDRVRLPGLPTAETAGVPDEALMPLVVATRDADGVDLSVIRGGALEGRVVDGSGRPVANAVLRAVGDIVRPTLGTDIVETSDDGVFVMRLPAGQYRLDASHARFAGVADGGQITIESGSTIRTEVTLVPGCVIAGRIVGLGGRATNDGAIERQWGSTAFEFAPTGTIESDGTFRWATTDEVDVVLRAWPWMSPPSESKVFSCRSGARYENVVFTIPDRQPDIAGVLRDHAGAPVPFANLDLAPLDHGGIAQQERTDAEGRFGVFHMPAGRYTITAHAHGRGVVSTTITSPRVGLELALSGTGRLEGTTALLENGSFELVLGACLDDGTVSLPRDHRLVSVVDSRFTVDDVPACDLKFVALRRGDARSGRAIVPAGGVAQIEIGFGGPDDSDEPEYEDHDVVPDPGEAASGDP
ncbi:MAG: carboxypeptidase regulatory-like domain-containing protein [Myxococcota bacterium]|nr:carboxypeptidase regulatory-like domain-containing protein [Myxococcota bacterium]